MKHGTRPRTGSSGAEPGATDWSVRGNRENTIKDAPDRSIWGGMKHGTSPRTGSSGAEPGATDWSVRGNGEITTKRHPGLEQPGQSGARPKPQDWIIWGRTRCHGLEHPRQQREYVKNDALDWSNRGGKKHGTSPRTGSSGGEPGATDWSFPGLEQPGRREARHQPPDWIVRG